MPTYRYILEMNETFEAPEGLSDEELERLAIEHAKQAVESHAVCPWPLE